MALIINSSKKISASTNAQTVNTACNTFLIANTSTSATVYIRENSDGVAVTEANAFPVLPGQTLPVALSASSISVKSSAAADVYFLFGTED